MRFEKGNYSKLTFGQDQEILKYYRLFLLIGSLSYIIWGPLTTEVLKIHHESWWWRPAGASLWILTYVLSYKFSHIRKYIKEYTFLGSCILASSFIWFVIGANQWMNIDMFAVGLFLIVFGSGLFIHKHKLLVVYNLIVSIMLLLSFKFFAPNSVEYSKIFIHTLVSLQTFLMLMHLILEGRNELISRIQNSNNNIKNILNSGVGPTLIIENDIVVFTSDSFKNQFGFDPTGNIKKDLPDEKSKFQKIQGKQVKIDQKDLFIDGKLCQVLSITDMTDEVNSNMKKLQLSKLAAVGELSAGIAHEINNPLMIIKMLLFDLKNSDERRQENLQTIDDTITKIANIVLSLKEYCSTSKEKPTKKVAIQTILNKVLGLTALKFDSEKISISVNVPDEEVFIDVQESQIGQVLINLINNSCYSIKNKDVKEIGINLEVVNNNAVITFEDSGEGIPEHIVDKIFDPFFSTKKQENQGMGLGLSESIGIIKKYQGSLVLLKNSPPVFEIKLPLYNNKIKELKK